MDLRQLEARADAVRTVERVVKAVWALARAQMPLADRAAAESVAHVDALDRVLARLAGAPRTTPHAPGGADALTVVIGPEHALTGGLAERVRRALPPEGALGVVGQRLHDLIVDGPEAARVRFHVPAPSSVPGLEASARLLAEAIVDARARMTPDVEVVIVHPMAGADVMARSVLLSGAREPVGAPPETLSPLADVIAEVAAQALTARLAAALAESLRAELRARLAAAGQAKQAAGDKLEEIDRLLRSARQGDVTREVTELAAARLAVDDLG
ncbi:MAG: F0F1 ATP synthase subunit gamma [Deltaproteobacteria bacterium]|nr:F0F1 ATP synthase subunit gamma [Deltaproteobacteria bacterium]